MELNRKELELLLHSLKPVGLSERTLQRLEAAITGDLATDASMRRLESRLAAQTPRALSEDTLNRLMQTVQDVPFALNQKVLLFPGSHKEQVAAPRKNTVTRRLLAVAACAAVGGFAALWTPISGPSSGVTANADLRPISAAAGLTLNDGIVATNFGSGIEAADDEGVVWTQDHQPKRVLRFQYKDRVLTRDKDGVDRMLLIPREEIYLIPEKVD